MKNIIRYKKPIICMEIGDANVNGIKKTKNLIDFLETKGYIGFYYEERKMKKIKNKINRRYENVLFLNKY